MSPVQRVAAFYVLDGYHQVMVRSSRVNVSETHQLLVLLGGDETHTMLIYRTVNAASIYLPFVLFCFTHLFDYLFVLYRLPVKADHAKQNYCLIN